MLVTVHEKLSAKLDGERWVILSSLGGHRWQVELWGPEPFQVAFVGLTLTEAKEHASALISLFLVNNAPEVLVPSQLEWRTVVSRTERRYKFEPVYAWPSLMTP